MAEAEIQDREPEPRPEGVSGDTGPDAPAADEVDSQNKQRDRPDSRQHKDG